MDLIKIKTNDNNTYYINANHVNQFMYNSNSNTTVIYTREGRLSFDGDKTKELAKMLTTIREGNLMVMGEEWTERSL